MRIHNRCDFNAGVLFLLIAAFFAVYSTDYSLGTATRMGPGYFPTMLAAIMAILGAITLGMAFSPLDAEDPPGRTDWRGWGSCSPVFWSLRCCFQLQVFSSR